MWNIISIEAQFIRTNQIKKKGPHRSINYPLKNRIPISNIVNDQKIPISRIIEDKIKSQEEKMIKNESKIQNENSIESKKNVQDGVFDFFPPYGICESLNSFISSNDDDFDIWQNFF
jgi:hypothetical protein